MSNNVASINIETRNENLVSEEQVENISLEQHRTLFKNRRFLAMPLAGTIVWSLIGLSSPFLSEAAKVWSIWLGTGSIFYLGLFLSSLTGEHFLQKSKVKNPFDKLFMSAVLMSLLVFAIAMPIAQIDYTTIPLSVGILSGLMWIVLSWTIEHWVGYVHAILRTLGIVLVWYLFPENRFEAIAAVIVFNYAISIYALEQRFKASEQ